MEEKIKAEVISVIHLKIKNGDGSEIDPVRIVHQYWSFEGGLLAEEDPHKIIDQ